MIYKQEKSTKKLEEGIEEVLRDSICNCLHFFSTWDLSELHKNLKLYKRTLSLIINNKRYDQLEEKFEKLEELKRKIEKDNIVSERERLEFFKEADKIFLEFSRALKDEDFIFSKKESYGEGSEDEVVEEN